jgi:phospholipid/cholesterol/gamma-HCH transport system permease protein
MVAKVAAFSLRQTPMGPRLMPAAQQASLRTIDAGSARVTIDVSDPARPIIGLSGAWRLRHGMPTAKAIVADLSSAPVLQRVTVEAQALTGWDSSAVNFLAGLAQFCSEQNIGLERGALPKGLNRLVDLAAVAPAHEERPAAQPLSLSARTGAAILGRIAAAGTFLEFLGNVALAMGSLLIGKARYRRVDLLEVVQGAGADALGIVTLISYLVGIILAFMGAVQLQQFGASVYVADLVGIAIVREMGAMMTGIIMSGRTGAAFAAQLGSMKVTQEIDALATMGISPIEFLVLPRIIALVLMMPLLCLYADLMGILGGATVAVGMLGITLRSYLHQTVVSITLIGVIEGMVKSIVYGILIGIAGCYHGFECGGSSSAVGDAATAAVVSSIVLIVLACGIFAVLFNILGI